MNGNSSDRKSSESEHNSSFLLTRRLLIGSVIGLFVAANVWCLRIIASRRKPEFKVTLNGPFPEGEMVAIEDAKADFVEPQGITINKKTDSAILRVQFLFHGPELSNRHIRLNVICKDSNGKQLLATNRMCKDQRVDAATPQLIGSRMVMFIPVNEEDFKISSSILDRISSIDLVFINNEA